MNSPPAMSMAFPKPRRALWIVLIALAVMGILPAFLATWVPRGAFVFKALWCDMSVVWHQPWRLLTSGLLTDPSHWGHLAFSLMGLYFLSPSLESRWGGWRFARFLALAIILGNLTVIAIATIAPDEAQGRFNPGVVFGPTAAISAIAVAWSREFAEQQVNVFFVLPVRGKVFLWVTLAFCVLDLIYPTTLPEGVVAPFGGVIAGLLFAGTPSVARTAWLHVRLAFLRRKASTLTIEDMITDKPKRRPRTGGPPLRVVSGGIDDSLKKRNPPKDKRYLN